MNANIQRKSNIFKSVLLLLTMKIKSPAPFLFLYSNWDMIVSVYHEIKSISYVSVLSAWLREPHNFAREYVNSTFKIITTRFSFTRFVSHIFESAFTWAYKYRERITRNPSLLVCKHFGKAIQNCKPFKLCACAKKVDRYRKGAKTSHKQTIKLTIIVLKGHIWYSNWNMVLGLLRSCIYNALKLPTSLSV